MSINMENRIGLDSITMTVLTTQNVKLDNGLFEGRTKENNIFLKIENTKTENQYTVTVILPCYVRRSNIQSFNVYENIELAKKRIRQNMQKKFGTKDLSSFLVKNLECNANKEISSKANIDMVIALMARALLQSNESITLYARGKRMDKTNFIKNPILDGFTTKRDTCCRFFIKVYNKGREMKSDKKLLRLEITYNSRGIKQALGLKRTITLFDILQRENLQKIVNRYIDDVQGSICPCIRLYKEDAEKLVQKELQSRYEPYRVFLKHYGILQYDYFLFREALKKSCDLEKKSKQSAIQKASRIKTKVEAEGTKIYEGAFRELEDFFGKIESQKVEDH